MKIYEKYLLREIIFSSIFFFIIFNLFFIFLKLIAFGDKIIDGSLTFFSALLLCIYLIPSFSIFIIPLVCLSSILFTFSRLSSSNEILALKSFGVNLFYMLKIPFFFGLVLFVAGIMNNIYIIPLSTKAFLHKVSTVLRISKDSFKPEIFNSIIPSTVIYFKKSDKKGNMEKIFIYSKVNNPPQIIVADKGNISVKNNIFHVNLKNGDIYIKKPEESEIISFDNYILKYDISKELGKFSINLKDKESSISKIKENIEFFKKRGNYKKVNYLLMEIHKRFALPFASVIFVVLGVLFGIRNARNPKSWTLFILFTVVFAYYSAIMVSNFLVKGNIISPFAGSWLPNILIGGVTLILIYYFNNRKV